VSLILFVFSCFATYNCEWRCRLKQLTALASCGRRGVGHFAKPYHSLTIERSSTVEHWHRASGPGRQYTTTIVSVLSHVARTIHELNWAGQIPVAWQTYRQTIIAKICCRTSKSVVLYWWNLPLNPMSLFTITVGNCSSYINPLVQGHYWTVWLKRCIIEIIISTYVFLSWDC